MPIFSTYCDIKWVNMENVLHLLLSASFFDVFAKSPKRCHSESSLTSTSGRNFWACNSLKLLRFLPSVEMTIKLDLTFYETIFFDCTLLSGFLIYTLIRKGWQHISGDAAYFYNYKQKSEQQSPLSPRSSPARLFVTATIFPGEDLRERGQALHAWI